MHCESFFPFPGLKKTGSCTIMSFAYILEKILNKVSLIAPLYIYVSIELQQKMPIVKNHISVI